jgi:hypothetical protein
MLGFGERLRENAILETGKRREAKERKNGLEREKRKRERARERARE